MLLSEYAMTDVSRPVLLNRELRQRGLLAVREIGGREYLDVELSGAFAMVDHQMAHVFVNGGEPEQITRVRASWSRSTASRRCWTARSRRRTRSTTPPAAT